MNLEYGQLPTFKLEPPRRVLDTTMPYFDDYGYRSSYRFLRSLGESMYKRKKPHLLLLLGEPNNGKEHILRDFIAWLRKGKRSEGFISKIEREQGHPVPIDAVYWGNTFSVGKAKGQFPEDLQYEEFSKRSMHLVTENFEELINKAISDREGEKSLIVVKGVLAGIRINGQLRGSNCGSTAYENLIKRRGPFAGLDYEVYTFGVIADSDAVGDGNKLRMKAEKKVDNPTKLAEELSNSGEIILTEKGENPQLTMDQQKAVKEYILDSANKASSDQIRYFLNDLAVELSQRGILRLNALPYRLNGYVQNEKKGFWDFPDPDTRMLAVALVMRYFLDTNLGLKNKVFLAKTIKLPEIILDLSSPPRNVARFYYDLEGIRNK